MNQHGNMPNLVKLAKRKLCFSSNYVKYTYGHGLIRKEYNHGF